MVKFGNLQWFYSQSGKWLTINSTDFDSVQSLASEICKFLSEHGSIRYKQFSAGGGSFTIENIVFEPKISDNIDDFMAYILGENEWVQDRKYRLNYRRMQE